MNSLWHDWHKEIIGILLPCGKVEMNASPAKYIQMFCLTILTHSGEATQFPAALDVEAPLFKGGLPSEWEETDPAGLWGGVS